MSMTITTEQLLANLNNAIARASNSAKTLRDDPKGTKSNSALIEYMGAISDIDKLIVQFSEKNFKTIQDRDFYKERLKLENALHEVIETFPIIKISVQSQTDMEIKQNSIETFYNKLEGLELRDLKEAWTVDNSLHNLFDQHLPKDSISFTSSSSSKTSDNKDFSRLQKMRAVGHYPFRILKALRNKFKARDKTGDRQPLLPQDEGSPKTNKRKT